MDRNFCQMITVQCSEPDALIRLIAEWDQHQATTDIMGYMGTRVLADRARPGYYVIIADFGVIDPDVSAAQEAALNNERPETKAVNAAITELLDGEPEYRNFDEVYKSGF